MTVPLLQNLTQFQIQQKRRTPSMAPVTDHLRTAHREVLAPSFIRLLRQEHRRTRACRPLSPTSSFHGQSLLGIDPVDLLVIGAEALAVQQDAEPAIAEPAAFTGQLSQPLA